MNSPALLAALSTIDRRLEMIERKIQEKRAPLTRRAFSRRCGFSLTTVCRKISKGEIRVENNRIPASELDKFLS